jgi:predicted O-methyltransferase YrrM
LHCSSVTNQDTIFMHKHPETFLELEKLGVDKVPPYRPTHEYSGSFIDASHEEITRYPLQDGWLIQPKTRRWFGRTIVGFLSRPDALKLYELAYFSAGDVLELGSHQGLSSSIMASAIRNSRKPRQIYAVDLGPNYVEATRSTLRATGLQQGVTNICGDATVAVKKFAAEGKKFGLVFIDHSHAYQPTYDVCRELATVTLPGGFCLFHDFNDPRNRDPADTEYKVYQAVMDGLDKEHFEFYGMYGCMALYRAMTT